VLVPAIAMTLLLGCKVDPGDFERSPVLDPIDIGGPTPPATATAGQEKLYQLLYATELGEQSFADGQQARMLAWLDAMQLSDAQLVQLEQLLDRQAVAEGAQQLWREGFDAREQRTLAPIYRRISAAYADGGHPDEATLSAFAAELQAAREQLYADKDPRAARLEQVQRLLNWVDHFIAGLSEQQRHELASCRFFLRRRLGPLLNPGDYGQLTGISWDGGDFRGVNTTIRDEDEGQMDIGGLWSTEYMRAPPGLYLENLELKALVVMALQEPGLREAIAVRRGKAAVRGGDAG